MLKRPAEIRTIAPPRRRNIRHQRLRMLKYTQRSSRFKKLTFVSFTLITSIVLTYTTLHVVAAGEVTQTWSFANAGDYTLSDADSIEVDGGAAKLKKREYSDDASTKALFHLNESSGTSVADSSSNGNTGTASVASWTTGNLNNGFSGDGGSTHISVPDSSSLSVTGTHTLEGWAKLNSSFSADSSDHNMGIMDKGDYKLYFHQSTGKLTYELANSSATSWSQVAGTDINGSWDLNGNLAVDSSEVVNGNLYVGLGNAIGDAEVWKWDGTEWSQVGGDGRNSSWADQTFESVSSLESGGDLLYAGLGTTTGDAEVWYCDTSTGCLDWTRIGGDGVNNGWAAATFEDVPALVYMGSTLYAGIGNSANDAEVWSWNGSTWTKIGGDNLNSGWNTNFESALKLVEDDTYVYAALGTSITDAEVWRWGGSTWTKIGGDGLNSSWNTNYESVLSMNVLGSDLYVGLGISADDAEVWKWSSGAWSQIGGDSLNSGWGAGYEGVYSLINDGTNLYAGLGTTAGDNEVWKWGGSSWLKIGGDAINSGFTNTHTFVQTLAYYNSKVYAGLTGTSASGQMWEWNGSAWSMVGGNYVNKSWGYYNLQSVEVLRQHAGKLYAGTGYTVAGNALIWEFNGSSWVLVGGQGVNGSWTRDTYELITAIESFDGDLYVGLGSSANDAEVWKYNGSSWTQVGGDSLNNGWATGYESVLSMTSYGGDLYAGLGLSANDAEVWKYNGSTWSKIGGDSINSGWTTNFEGVYTLTPYNGYLYAGLGNSAADAEVWRWDGNAWFRIGGDGINSGWSSVFEFMNATMIHDNELYVGLGSSTGDAYVYKWNGSAWSLIGGDETNGSWSAGTYERVRALVSYNGKLYAGLGVTAGESEVWVYNGSAWTEIGGDTLNSSWANNATESVHSLATYKGKLYAGLGETANTDAAIWSYGNNGFLQSDTASFDTNWHHYAATYDGSTMKIYIDGVLDGSTSTTLTIPDTSNKLLLGTTFGSKEQNAGQGFLDGILDEVRISNSARSSFNSTPYSADAQTVHSASAVFAEDISAFNSFSADETANGGTITYRLSTDNGSTWKYWNGSSWATSSSTSEANDEATVNTNISDLPISSQGIKWQAILDGNGNQEVTLTSVSIAAEADTTNPEPPSSLTALNTSGGNVNLTTNTWYTYTTPYFSWNGASDTESGVAGYFVYFGTDNTAVPSTAGSFQAGTSYSASGLVSGQTYYLRIQTKDNAQNVSSVYAPFIYKLDTSTPSNPATITVTPSGYASTNSFTFAWPSSGANMASDVGSGIAGYQYKTGASSGPLSDWSTTITDTSVEIADAAYQTNANTFYLRTIDNAGNVTGTPLQATYYFAGEGPSAPQFLTATPSTNTTNSFAFSWDPPETFTGEEGDLTYCYTINTLPAEATCTYTSAGATSLSASAFATQVGLNTFYVVAKSGEDVGGAINYGAYASVSFTANTAAPGIPLNLEISDVSIKSSEAWRLALSWTAPEDVGSGVANYKIFRSTDGETYTSLATTTGSAYIDTSLDQETYYYKVKACDSVANCGAFTSEVSLLPTGKFTTAAELDSEPEVSNITTKRALVSWSTDRTSDSKVQYGTKSGEYFDEEPSNSTQVTAHEIALINLKPGTKYYAVAKWTDEDGNTGVSDEFTFSTLASPVVSDPKVKVQGLDRITLQFTVKGADKVKIYYGKTTAFGGTSQTSTSTAEATYDVTIQDLEDATKYYYKINGFDSEGEEYEGNVLSFETLPRPRISDVRIQQVKNSAQSTIVVSWATNTEVSSIATYYPEGNPSASRDEVDVALKKGKHQLVIKNLLPQTRYALKVSGRDVAGNEAQSDIQLFTTATDTRPVLISNIKVEASNIKTTGNKAVNSQLVVSWTTDEGATSQIEYGEGTGTTYSQKTQEDTNLKTNHLVVITGLSPSKVYHLRAVSKDKAGNITSSVDTVTITAKATDNALDLVVDNLKEVFGFIGQ